MCPAFGVATGTLRPTLADKHEDRLDLRADCGNCFGLCCVAPAFSASGDFAVDKPAGQSCPNLQPDFRCRIHQRLRPEGFRGCAVYECFGAGQKVSRFTFSGRTWSQDPGTAAQMFEVFPVMRQLHELLWYLAEAITLDRARPLHAELRLAFEASELLTRGGPDEVLALDMAGHRRDVNALLLTASELVRADVLSPDRDRRQGTDLIGADLEGADLRGANLRGACLIGADLRRADLYMADVTGADFRDADLSGADLTGTIFLVQHQLDAARGDPATRVPPSLTLPAHW